MSVSIPAAPPETKAIAAPIPELTYDMIGEQVRRINRMPMIPMSPSNSDVERIHEDLRRQEVRLEEWYQITIRHSRSWDREPIEREYSARRRELMVQQERLSELMNIMPRRPMNAREFPAYFDPWSRITVQPRPTVPPMPAEPQKTGLATLEIDSSEIVFLREYQRIASKVGFASKEARVKVREADLVEWLQAEAMPIYDYQTVKAYLDGIVARCNAENYPNSKVGWKWILVVQYGTLDKPIPMPVLMTMEKVVDRFGSSVEMSISEITKYPDPFLSVHVPGSERRFVIERWDEPGFRDKA